MRALKTMPGRDPSRSGSPQDADREVTALYLTHYRPLVRMAALLVQDLAAAEEIDAVEERIRRAVRGGLSLREARAQHGYHKLQTRAR